MKLITFVVILMGSFVPQGMASDKILQFEGQRFKFKLEYFPNNKEVKLRYKKAGSWGGYKTYGPLEVDTPTKVDLSLSMLDSFFDRNVISNDSRNKIKDRVHEYKFISPKECQALHFSLESSVLSDKAITGLMAEVEKIRMAQNPGGDAYRSLLVREFETESDGTIQLRMVLDKDGEFLKFSFARDSKNLSDYIWNQEKGMIHLKNPRGETILQVDFNNFSKQGGLLIVRHPKEEGVEQAARSYFRFSRAPASMAQSSPWSVRPYTTQHFSETVIKDGVALTSSMAGHTAVIQLHNSEVAFPRYSESKIREVLVFKNLPKEKVVEIEGYYNRCMGERLSFIFEEESQGISHGGDKDKEQELICQRNAQLEGISIYLQEKVNEYGAPEDVLTDSIKSLRACLVEKKVGSIEQDIFNFDYPALFSLTEEDMQGVFQSCSYEPEKTLTFEVAKHRVLEVGDALEKLDNPRTLELLWTTVSSSLRSDCLDVVPGESLSSCLDYAKMVADQNLLLAELSAHLSQLYSGDVHKFGTQRLSLVKSFESCREEYQDEVTRLLREGNFKDQEKEIIKEKELSCSRSLARELGLVNAKASFQEALSRTGLSFSDENLDNEELFTKSKETYASCLEDEMEDEGSVGQIVSRLSFHQEVCLTQAIQPYAQEELMGKFKSLFDEYDFLHTDEQRARVIEKIERKIKNQLENWNQVEGLGKIKEELMPTFYGTALQEHIVAIEENLLGEDNAGLQNEFKKAVEGLLSDSSSRPMSLKTKKYFEVVLRNSERGDKTPKEYLDVTLKEILGEAHKVAGPLVTEKELIEFVLLDSDREAMKGRVDEVFSECIEEFSPNRTTPLQRKYAECEKKRIAKVSIELTRRRLEQKVSSVFPLTSIKANRALTPIQYLELCYENIDPYGSKTVEEYRSLAAGCERIAELDVSYNLSVAKVEGYRPLLSRRGYHDAVTAYCYNIIFHHMSEEDAELKIPRRGDYEGAYRDLTAMQQAQRKRSPDGGSLLKYFSQSQLNDPEFSASDQKQVKGLVETFAANESFDQEWWGEKLAHCEKGTNDFVMVSFRQFVIESIPALNWTDASSPNEKVMRDFLDFELVSSLLDYKQAFERKHGVHSLDIGNTVPSERNITPEMGVTALTNFIQILGGYLSRGFIYDEKAMRTELIVFQSELKAFLKWSASNPDKISIREARDFFKESKLVEHLSMAVISQSVHDKFIGGIRTMEQEEKEEFLKDNNCRYVSCLKKSDRTKYNQIAQKYKNLKDLAYKMTSSYDFRRIIRPESANGKEIVDAIKDTYLMPKILGEDPTPQAEERIMKLIGDAILRDNTSGGFADMFAHEAAQFALDQESDRRWGLTKWLWFDSKDFDWNTLKHTDSGRKAVNYYARYIMLPSFLGKTVSNYQKEVRLEHFRRLLTDAQGENSD
ncbi:MAG: hypothetical protein NXH75_03835 [Halobacteriovoraceae bacterium]|nr:hypothetical protein [Halobacteriovoraceae bacterium]